MTIYIPGSDQENYVITDPKVINYFNDKVYQIKQDFLKLHNTINKLENRWQKQSRQIDQLEKRMVGGNLCLKIFFFLYFFKEKYTIIIYMYVTFLFVLRSLIRNQNI